MVEGRGGRRWWVSGFGKMFEGMVWIPYGYGHGYGYGLGFVGLNWVLLIC